MYLIIIKFNIINLMTNLTIHGFLVTAFLNDTVYEVNSGAMTSEYYLHAVITKSTSQLNLYIRVFFKHNIGQKRPTPYLNRYVNKN